MLDITDEMVIVEFDRNGNQYQEIKNVKMPMLGKVIEDGDVGEQAGEFSVKSNSQLFINRVPSVLTRAETQEVEKEK